jgi:hypothetical protein
MKYEVLRQHFGDRMYMPGDEREALAGDVAHLVTAGVLGAPSKKPAKKAEPAPKNKAEAGAPTNKAGA